MNRLGKKHAHKIGFNHAWDGLVHAFKHHPNIRIHLFISLLVILVALILQVTYIELLILILCIILGIVIELVNTAIESVVDLVTEEWRLSAKNAKDVASAAVLITAIGTSIIGLLIFLPYLLRM